MEKIYNFIETETKTKEATADFLDMKILTDGTSSEPEKIKRDIEDVDVSCFVLLTDSKQMKVRDGSYNIDLLGNPMYQYVVRACPNAPTCLKFDEEEGDVLKVIKPYLKETEYTLVLFSDTPLVTKANVLNILDFVKSKGLNVCKLTRGYVFKNEYIRRVDEVYAPSTYYFEEEDFMMAVNYKQLYIISETLKNRIITYHLQNGVYFKSPDSTYIEANVSLGSGTIVEPFTRLIGDTDVAENVLIGAGSTLINAKVFEYAELNGAYIEGAIIKEKVKIKNGAKLFSQTAIKEGATVGEDAIISNAIVGEQCVVGRTAFIKYLNAEEEVCIGDYSKILGTETKPVSIAKGANISDIVTIMQGVKISANSKIEMGEVLKAGEIR